MSFLVTPTYPGCKVWLEPGEVGGDQIVKDVESVGESLDLFSL